MQFARDATAAAQERARRREERRQALRAKAVAACPGLTLPIVVLPGFEGGVADNENRRAAFLEAFAAQARRAFEQTDAQVPLAGACGDEAGPPDGTLAALLAHACALCRGHCCRAGGNHAYLTPESLRDIALKVGITRWQDLVDLYRPLVPDLGYRDSCIFHGSDGCALPRSLRSQTCKRYHCAGARELMEESARGSATAMLLSTNVDGELETEPTIWSAAVVTCAAVPPSDANSHERRKPPTV